MSFQSHDKMRITVVLPTHNRCRELAETLKSIALSELPDSVEWNVVVVDNNSTDQTRAVAEEFSSQYPGRFRYLFEPQPGKSYSLNAGIRAARGEILAFTEDDVTVEPSWLRKLTAPLIDNQWSGVGGRIVLHWPPSVPSWLSTSGPYARHGFLGFDLGSEAKELVVAPFGANMAFRKSVFERQGGFRTDLCLSHNNKIPRSCIEEIEFGRRVIYAGKHLFYEPAAVVTRPVPEGDLSKKFILASQFDRGRAWAREFPFKYSQVIRSVAAWTLRWMVSLNPGTRFYRKLVLWEKAGIAAELNRMRSEQRRKNAQKRKTARRDAEERKRDRTNLLHLKAGEWVEVRQQEEILATLDGRGCLGNLPFMPEMLNFSGKRFRVYKRADKTCDNIEAWSIRRMSNTVHLEGVRCDGEAHGGCEAGCLIFWKEAWLKRAQKNVVPAESLQKSENRRARENGLITVASLLDASSRIDERGETFYTCQATELLRYTSYMRPWNPWQYVRDLRSGNVASGLALDSRSHRALETLLGILFIFRSVTISLFNAIQEKRHGRPSYPFVEGSAEKTPAETLNLQPGEIVQVRSKEEIMATLDKQNRNRGMLFDSGNLVDCGSFHRVLRRVSRIVDEKTGRILEMKNPCIVLEGVLCRWDYHRLCPKASYPYWREIWLKRAVDLPEPLPAQQIAESCEKS